MRDSGGHTCARHGTARHGTARRLFRPTACVLFIRPRRLSDRAGDVVCLRRPLAGVVAASLHARGLVGTGQRGGRRRQGWLGSKLVFRDGVGVDPGRADGSSRRARRRHDGCDPGGHTVRDLGGMTSVSRTSILLVARGRSRSRCSASILRPGRPHGVRRPPSRHFTCPSRTRIESSRHADIARSRHRLVERAALPHLAREDEGDLSTLAHPDASGSKPSRVAVMAFRRGWAPSSATATDAPQAASTSDARVIARCSRRRTTASSCPCKGSPASRSAGSTSCSPPPSGTRRRASPPPGSGRR